MQMGIGHQVPNPKKEVLSRYLNLEAVENPGYGRYVHVFVVR